ncbi:Vacuolar membrane PQ loop repeat protein [Rasamsonia emersonii CBS 393.64]|uniref:Vacuolar membrane PQ loop repeat protein n=1 Tax=Rasamsonia emersonii (strain ATCC 16479 / CBS 393.64 / IMI 116815) TaxID=1408163 RepID=A0A0F4YV22_RASE3|nr:Vacuolar membrane PQ loop repeat protein [Rasamsonia emersonii CBS 393.64]KKA21488.1 Vacuolar membrane PQ loop repeat protein [Rasamsonia emersonii CBS 393.64]
MATQLNLARDGVPLTAREAASGILGSISLTCWMFLLLPQLIENYRNGSAEGISMAFLLVWFVGDVTNFIGGVWAQLVPVVIAIAVYFCIADGVLIGQCLYYNIRNARRERRRQSVYSSTEPPTPTTPLLGRSLSDDFGLTGSRRRRSSASLRDGQPRRTSHPEDTLAKIVEEGESGARAWVKNLVSVLAIAMIGTAGWAIAWQTGMWKPSPEEHGGRSEMVPGAQVLGYFSAICYLGARLPQIYKNYTEKSCEGKNCRLTEMFGEALS